MSYDSKNYSNPFSDHHGPPEPQSNSASQVIVILAAIGFVCLIMCGGLIAGVYFMVLHAEREFEVAMDEIEMEMANQDFNLAFQTDADLTAFHQAMGMGDYVTALNELDLLLEQYPDDPVLHNNKSWLLATCPDGEIRNGTLAVEHGRRACELSDWAFPEYIDTLAAACAEAGDFEEAVRWQQKAIDEAALQYQQQFAGRLALYQSDQPYREGVPSASPVVDESTDSFDETAAEESGEREGGAEAADESNADPTGNPPSDAADTVGDPSVE
jgi:tetratricopeptide (TPR) repeat protein